MSQDNLIKMACSECSTLNYFDHKNMRKLRGVRLEKNKFCKKCGKHTLHKERK